MGNDDAELAGNNRRVENIFSSRVKNTWFSWMPAFAGMTKCETVPFSVIPDLIGNPEGGSAPPPA